MRRLSLRLFRSQSLFPRACLLLALAALTALGLLATGCGGNKTDSPLLQGLEGTWISDADATVAVLKAEGRLTPEQIERLAPIFGKLTVTYKGDVVSSTMPAVDISVPAAPAVAAAAAGSNAAVSPSAGVTRLRSRVAVLEEDGNGGRLEFLRLNAEDTPEWMKLLPERMVYRIELDGDGYWLMLEDDDGSASGVRERFMRLKAAE